MKQTAFASMVLAVSALALSACATATPRSSSVRVESREAVATTAGDESLHLSANTTTPDELRTRLAYPLRRPSLARIRPPVGSSWVFALRASAVSPEETRPAMVPGGGEPIPADGGMGSDPLAHELITTMAEANIDGARLRYVP